jgi:adenylate cyclase, class 2
MQLVQGATTVSFEVEIKFRTDSAGHTELERRLAQLAAEFSPACEQEDIYVSHPARDFGETGEAFRLRREGEANYLTYKGPRQTGPTKTREEIEIEFSAGADALLQMRRVWELLGFRPVAILHKRRQANRLVRDGRALAVVLDLAQGLGEFAEVETIAADAADLPAAQAAVLDLARTLGLTAVEPRSYLRMALEQGLGAAPAGGEEKGPSGPRNLAGQT